MIFNYLKTAWRNLWKSKFYSGLNILGLAIGLGVGIMILLWVRDELSYDKFHKNTPELYRVISNIGSGSSQQSWSNSPAPIATYGRKEVAPVVNAVRITPNYDYVTYRYNSKEFSDMKAAYTDSTFFNVFSFQLISGNKDRLFPSDNSIILSQSLAKSMFGDEDPIGKVIIADKKDSYIVGGVMADFPANSSMQYNMLFSTSVIAKTYTSNDYWKSMDEDWGNYNFATFLQIKDQASLESVEKKLTTLLHDHNQYDKTSFFTLQAFDKIHLYTADGNSGAMQIVRIFLAVAIFLLVIACINYVNLSTARSLLRSREVSMRKVIGAPKWQLFLQFVVETGLLFVLSTILACLLIFALMPLYNNLSGKQLTFNLTDPGVWKIIGITILGTLAASSIYPALLLASFKPIEALKGKISSGIGSVGLRRSLVVIQFVFSITLIISTIIIARQLSYIRNKQLGYDRSYVFTMRLRNMGQHYDAVRNELMKQPGITGVSCASGNIMNLGSTTGDTDWDGKEPKSTFVITQLGMDKEFMSMMNMQLAEGKGFTGTPADSVHVILNETAVKKTGIKDPVGKIFSLHDVKCTIIGVVKDFHFRSLKEKIDPSIFYYRPVSSVAYVKTTGKDAPKAIAAAQKLWKQYNADFPFTYKFMDENFENMYKADQQAGVLFEVFAIIAIFISCVGLFGLATYTAQVKQKEIGIRKVIGASVLSITTLLSREFLKLVLLSIVIASPLAGWLMYKWMQDFNYRTSIPWWVFPLSGLLAVLIALATVSIQAVKAALVNPVKSLKSE
ncbi:MAG: ABC transporter permease [Chitinophagaceae bacterium]